MCSNEWIIFRKGNGAEGFYLWDLYKNKKLILSDASYSEAEKAVKKGWKVGDNRIERPLCEKWF